ncbi:MAG: glycosyltransferase, partial [Patescibacteria group bacterium]
MKILIATGIYPPDIGGPATWTRYFAEEFTKRGHEVVVLTYSDNLEDDKKKWRVSRVLRRSGRDMRHLKYFFEALSFMRESDVTLLGDTISAGVPVWAASFFTRRPYVLKIGGDWVWEQAFQRWGVQDFLDEFLQKRYSAKIEFFRWLQSRVARKSRAVLAPSNYLKTVAVAWGMPPGNIYTIYNNIYSPKVLPSREEARATLGLGLKIPVLLS